MGTIIRIPAEEQGDMGTVELLAATAPHPHAVQFYEEPRALFETVAKFLSAGLAAGDRVVVIATAAHAAGITRAIDPTMMTQALASRQLTMLDAHETLDTFMEDDAVDPARFHEALERILGTVRADAPDARVRAFGEMVDVLWRAGNSNAALRLEELWGEASAQHSFTLLCAYVMGNFYGEPTKTGFDEVCARHTHVFPRDESSTHGPTTTRATHAPPPSHVASTQPPPPSRVASTQAPPSSHVTSTLAPPSSHVTASRAPCARLPFTSLDPTDLEEHVRSLEAELHHRRGLEAALREALRDRSRVEAELRESVTRERDARATAEENDRFKEQFLAILGHDLRNPLNTILTTTRLMVMRGELAPESTARLDRVIANGVRMQRMIEQILDVTSDRLSGGIPIVREPGQDIAAVTSRVVTDARLAHPAARVEQRIDGACTAVVDAERLEQVLRTIVGNAIAHGETDTPVRVCVAAREEEVRIEVQSSGPPIAPEDRELLFEPFKRDRKTRGRSDGLGLGLYISKRIVEAHDGRLEVESSNENGTLFRVVLPHNP
ncbi:MAG: MEDS domain-containing protein [Labilithrix sp.]|nr:MEDS domain-containing protein [Labilithrix sp.]